MTWEGTIQQRLRKENDNLRNNSMAKRYISEHILAMQLLKIFMEKRSLHIIMFRLKKA